MLKLIWSKLKWSEKIGLAVILVLLIYISFQAVQIAYKDHQLLNSYKSQIEDVIKGQEKNTRKIDSTIAIGKAKTKQALKTKKALDKKLEDDKKIIDNRVITDDELRKFLTRYD